MGLNWGRLVSAIPGVNTAQDIYNGDWKKAGVNLATGGLSDTGAAFKGGFDEKYQKYFKKPYEDKEAGVQAIQDEVARLKQERMAQKDYAYNLADSKYEPTRKAIHAVYGDPESWKL